MLIQTTGKLKETRHDYMYKTPSADVFASESDSPFQERRHTLERIASFPRIVGHKYEHINFAPYNPYGAVFHFVATHSSSEVLPVLYPNLLKSSTSKSATRLSGWLQTPDESAPPTAHSTMQV